MGTRDMRPLPVSSDYVVVVLEPKGVEETPRGKAYAYKVVAIIEPAGAEEPVLYELPEEALEEECLDEEQAANNNDDRDDK